MASIAHQITKWNELREIARSQGDHYAVSRITRIITKLSSRAWEGVGTN